MKNATVSLVTQILLLLSGFFSRKIFIDYLGAEVLGLNTTATSILNALNLLEMGIWSAVAVTLYKPIYDGDKEKIKELVAFQAWLYKIIAVLVLAGSCIVMLFFPKIFSKTTLPMWYPYATFLVLVYSTMLKFFVNYRRVLIYADQQDYKIIFVHRILNIIKLVMQAFCVIKFENGFLWWIILEFVFSTFTTILTNRIVFNNYPYLKEKVPEPEKLRFKFPDVIGKMKLIACHNIGYFAINQLSPMLIYAFASLTTVAMYGNYSLLTVNLATIISSLEAGTGAGVGNMVAEGDKRLINKVFKEYLAYKAFISGFCALCLWFLIEPFICVWLGSEYILDMKTLLLAIVAFAVSSFSSVFKVFINAYGLFQDIWASLSQCLVSVVLSIILGTHYGLNGVLLGCIIPDFLINMIWKPIFLYKQGFQTSIFPFILLYLKLLLIFAVTTLSVMLLSPYIPMDKASSSLWSFAILGIMIICIIFVIYMVLMYAFDKGFRDFVSRLLTIFRCR